MYICIYVNVRGCAFVPKQPAREGAESAQRAGYGACSAGWQVCRGVKTDKEMSCPIKRFYNT